MGEGASSLVLKTEKWLGGVLAGPRAGQDVRVGGANRRSRCPAWTGAAQFSVTASPLSVAQDAAHIRWVHAAGSDEEANGLDLCVLYPKLFDRGRAAPSAACCR